MDSTRDQNYAKAERYISTDCESSAAEDVDSYFIGRFESAEFALLFYSRFNNISKLQALLDAKLREDIKLDLNFKGQQKQNFSWSALHLACYFGHDQVVALLLSQRKFRDELDVNIQNISGDTPLHKATLTNRAQIVQTLLSSGVSVFIKNCDGLMAKQLTTDPHILDMLEAAEQVDRSRLVQELFKTVDNGDLEKLKASVDNFSSSIEADLNTEGNQSASPPIQQLCQMVDDRGNTLLHLAAMRGFQALCIYLLEQGLDPYRKNNLGQSCIDLASYQLRQLFTTVKPAKSKVNQLSKQSVNRFEGPLMKKVRILGWKQIYVVLENGVILLFNNRRDSMNRSRKGYKYLESATCQADPNDLGTFTICFSDRSRATFLVTTAHLNSYTSYKYQHEQDRSLNRGGQIDLIRQKWLNAIKDHISYSTNFVRLGLKIDDDDDNDVYRDGDDLATFNHLLPIDTIKSFVQEARAHYSILERHAASLCNLIQSISVSERNSDNLTEDDVTSQDIELPTGSNTTSSGNKLLRLIRSSRQNRTASGDDTSQTSSNVMSRRRNNSLTNEFVQDNWHCILFHLRLLIESTENTKVSMGQALALMEHQEELRQNRIQDQEERCRVLEDSLHALAIDHHELEKSVSMSQLYHSAHSAAVRSTSMSTDLNEYFDAFDDFDDEKTMTPTSMSSDDEVSQMGDHEAGRKGPSISFEERVTGNRVQTQSQNYQETDEDNSDEDDLRSNCSALTIATNSDYLPNLDPKQSSQLVNNENRGSSSYVQSSTLKFR